MSMLDVAKTGACVSARQNFAGTLAAIARDLSLISKKPLCEAGKVRASKSCARVSKTWCFYSYLIRDSSRQCKRAARVRDVLALGPRQQNVWFRDSD